MNKWVVWYLLVDTKTLDCEWLGRIALHFCKPRQDTHCGYDMKGKEASKH